MAALLSRREVLQMPAVLAMSRITAAAAPHWPAFRGPGGSGVADDSPTPIRWNADPRVHRTTGVAWSNAIPGLGHSSPIIWNDRIWLATAVRETGLAPLRLGLYGDGDAADDNGLQRWVIYCLDKNTGEIVWSRTVRSAQPRAQRHTKATHANTTLATDGRRLVSFFGSEGVHCHTLDGQHVWSLDLGVINVSKYGIGWGFGSSPVLFRDRIVLQCDAPDNPFVVALRVDDGRELWRTSRKGVCERSWATPLVYDDGRRVQVVTNGWPFVVSYDFGTGKELWRLRGGGDNPIPTPFAAHGLIYVANGHGGQTPLFAIRPTASGDVSLAPGETSNAHIAWSAPRNNAYIQTPLVYGDYLYSGTNSGVLKCYDARTGIRQYEQRLGDGTTAFSASPVAGGGHVYFTSEDGDVFVVKAGPRYELLAHNRMGASCLATPAISAGRLYFRTRHQVLAVSGESSAS